MPPDQLPDPKIQLIIFFLVFIDAQLDEMVTAAPNYEERMVHGLLASRGIKVQRQRLRHFLRRVDPVG